MKRIRLTQNKYALIDDCDYSIVSLFKWCAQKSRDTFYAHTWINLNGKATTLKMHRLIMNLKPNEDTDHADMNGLNNQRYNLRICNKSQNAMNGKGHKDSSSQFKGVNWAKRDKKWRACIAFNHKDIHIGYFNSEIKAALAYNKKAKELFGEFAYLNFR